VSTSADPRVRHVDAVCAVTASIVILLVLTAGFLAGTSPQSTAPGRSAPASGGINQGWIPDSQAAKLPHYSIIFRESGLSLLEGRTWNVSINQTKKSSSTSLVTFHERPGTYRFVVGGELPYFLARPANGTVTVGTSNVTVRIKFASQISDAFDVENPSTGFCSAANVTAHVCDTVGDFTYTLVIPSSTVHFGEIRFEVETSKGHPFSNARAAGFAVLNESGGVAAYSEIPAGTGLTMSAAWQHYSSGTSNSTVLTSLFTIVIDTGKARPTTGYGLAFVAHGKGHFFGSTSPFSLP
jgi:hypothetical protein